MLADEGILAHLLSAKTSGGLDKNHCWAVFGAQLQPKELVTAFLLHQLKASEGRAGAAQGDSQGGHKEAAALGWLPPRVLVRPWWTRPAAAENLLFFTHIWGAKISLDCTAKNP